MCENGWKDVFDPRMIGPKHEEAVSDTEICVRESIDAHGVWSIK